MRPIPDQAIVFLKQHEACRLDVYDDARPAYKIRYNEKPIGKITVGYGHAFDTWPKKVSFTQAECDVFLNADVLLARFKLYKCADKDVIALLTDNRYAALLSFVFNCGANRKWRIWDALNKNKPSALYGVSTNPSDWSEFILCLKEFCHDNGKIIPGLQNRRNAEIDLWNTN